MSKLIEAVIDSGKYIIDLDPSELLNEAGNIIDVEYRYQGAAVASLVVDEERNVVTLRNTDLISREIQISWLFPESFHFDSILNINLASCDLFLFGNILLGNKCQIDCRNLTLLNDAKSGKGRSRLDAKGIVINTGYARLQGIVGCPRGKGESKLEEFILNSTGYVSIHGIVDSERCHVAVRANSFRTSGCVNVSKLSIRSDSELITDSNAVLIAQDSFNLSAKRLVHRGYLGCKNPSSPLNSNFLSGTEELRIPGEVTVDGQRSTKLSTEGDCYLTKELAEGVHYNADYSSEKLTLLVNSPIKKVKKTFIMQVKEDLANYRAYLEKYGITQDVKLNREELLSILQAAVDAAEERQPQDKLADAYKDSLRMLRRSQDLISYWVPGQNYWRPPEPLELILRDTLQKLSNQSIIGFFSDGYDDFSSPDVVDTSSPISNTLFSYSGIFIFPAFTAVTRGVKAGVCLSKYAHPCYLLLNGRFEDTEKYIAFSSIILLSTLLSNVGLSRYVDMMHSESLLIQATLREFMAAIRKNGVALDGKIEKMLVWVADSSSERSFFNRLIQFIVQMLLSPMNSTLASIVPTITSESKLENLLGFLRGIAITLIPAMRYLNVLKKTGEYIGGGTVDNFSMEDFLCGVASFIAHYYLGDSPATHRILNKALSEVKQADSNLPIPEYLIGKSASSFLKNQQTMTARAVLWAGHAIKVGALEQLSSQFSNANALPATFSESFYLVNQILPSHSHLFVRYSVSYLLSRVLEAQLAVDMARTKLKSLAKAHLLKTVLYKSVSSVYYAMFGRTDLFSLFLSTDSERPLSYYLLDIVVLLSISDIHERLEKASGAGSSSGKIKLASSWLYMYYVLISDYSMELYSDIANFSATGDYKVFWSEHLVYHLLRIYRSVSIGVAVAQHIRTGLDEISEKESLEKRKAIPLEEAEIIEKEDLDTSPAGSEGGGGFAEDVPSPSEVPSVLVQVVDRALQTEALPSWIRAGGFFTGNRRMDILRYELLYMQVYASRHFLDPMMFGASESSGYESQSSDHKYSRQDFRTATDYVFRGWELLDSTDRILDRIQFCTSYHKIGKWKFWHSKKTKTKSRHESDFIKNKPDAFKEANTWHYHGIAVRHIKYNITAILTAGTRMGDARNWVPDYNLYMESKPNQSYCNAGKAFVDYIRDTYSEGKYPGIYVGHSLGCSFSMWMNAVTKGGCYVMNVDAFGSSAQNIHRTCWHRNKCEPDLTDSNVDSIIGSPSPLNNYGNLHIGSVLPLDNSTSGSRAWKKISNASIFSRPHGFIAAKAINNIVSMIDHHDSDRIKTAYRRKLEADTDINLENETINNDCTGLLSR